MQLSPDQISQNWDKLLFYIDKFISDPRKTKLLEFYKKFEERLCLMPASHKTAYHNCFPGGYVEHVNRVIEASLKLDTVWREMGVEVNYTHEELVFSALNHDLGKMGSLEEEMYKPNSSTWHIENRGELYEVNNKLTFMSVPDRSLYLLTISGITYSENEFLAIKLHDGVYDEANKPYLMTYLPETKPRTSLIFIIHQADILASRIEFEREWFPKFYGPTSEEKPKKKKWSKTDETTKALKDIKINPELLNTFFNK